MRRLGPCRRLKPDPRIYEILFARVGRPPSELLFIDDSIANVRASEAAGMPAIHYRPGFDLESELVARGALPCSLASRVTLRLCRAE